MSLRNVSSKYDLNAILKVDILGLQIPKETSIADIVGRYYVLFLFYEKQ